MRLLVEKYGKYLLLAALACCGSVLRGQDAHSIRLVSVPPGRQFTVDGNLVNGAANAMWPVGSKHTLSVQPVQMGTLPGTRFTFSSWTIGGVAVNPSTPTVVVTADKGMSTIEANFQAEYALMLRFFQCSAQPCQYGPGVVYAGSTAYQSDTDIWVAPGGTVAFQAVPNTGWVFTGWQLGSSPLMPTFNLSVTADSPKGVYPKFGVARLIQFETSPAKFKIVADRTTLPTPNSLEWAWDSDHMVGAISPQQDSKGLWWVFSSWSDEGSLNHAYRVQPFSTPATITATYVPGVPTSVLSSPPGLKLKVDGNDVAQYTAVWASGEKHQVEAPPRVADAQGFGYVFKEWSNGGKAAQSIAVPPELQSWGIRLVATYTPLAHITVSSALKGAAVQVDGADCPRPCVVERNPGAAVKLSVPSTVALGDGSRADFAGWSDGVAAASRVLSAPAEPVSLEANFRVMNRLTAVCEPPEGARMSAAPPSGDSFYESGTAVTLAMEARAGYRFRQWAGDASGSSPMATVNMSAPRAVRGVFEKVPYATPAGVRNGAADVPNVASGAVVSIFGANLAPEALTGPDNPLAQTLGGVTVRLGDRFLPLFFVSPEQINAQFPSGLEPGPQTLTVRWEGHPEVRVEAQVARNAPGLFQDANGVAAAAGVPARRGQPVTVYGTGFGPTLQPRPDGFAVPYEPQFPFADAVEVLWNGVSLAPESAFAAPGKTGVDAVTFRVPANASPGSAELKVRVNGIESNAVRLPVE